jgi:hypothetical protein
MGRSHRGKEVGEMGERGEAGEWSLYVVASDEERRDEGIVLYAIRRKSSSRLCTSLVSILEELSGLARERDVYMPKAQYPRLTLQGALLAGP